MQSTRILTNGSVDWMERVAVFGTAACLVHCLALPLLLSALPAMSSILSVPESAHLWMLAIAAPAALFALVQGRVRHRVRFPLRLGLVGLALLAAGALSFGETWAETPVTIAGSLLLGAAHIANWRLRHACRC